MAGGSEDNPESSLMASDEDGPESSRWQELEIFFFFY